MRPRPLDTESPLVRATIGGQLRTSLGAGLRQLGAERFETGLAARQFEMRQATRSALGEEAQEAFREIQRNVQQRRIELTNDLLFETDPIRIEQLNGELTSILDEAGQQRDAIEREAVEDGRLIDPETAQEEYGIEADRPLSRREAELIVQGQREQEIRKAIADAGPRGVVPGILRFGATAYASATDPIGLASAFIPIAGPAFRAASVARLGRVAGRAAVGAP